MALLVGCSVVRDTLINSAVGFPAAHVVRDVRSTSAEYEEKQHKKRVEELNREYEKFVRSGEACTLKPTDSTTVMAFDQTDPRELDCVASSGTFAED